MPPLLPYIPSYPQGTGGFSEETWQLFCERLAGLQALMEAAS
jgi:hypothetical protein